MNRQSHFAFLCLISLIVALVPGPPPQATEVTASEAGFYYTVQRGDTLWELSERFNNSPWLWPELWEENGQIRNPHWIFPGERIRLYKKSDQQQIAGSSAVAPAPPADTAAPSAKRASGGPHFVYPPINRVGFIRKPAVPPLGTIFDVQGRKVLISEGDNVYLRAADDAPSHRLMPGSRHTIYRTLPPTSDSLSTETIGTQHYILGILEIVAQTPEMYIAKVLKSYRDIRVNDMIMPFDPRRSDIAIKASTPGIDGRIIASEEHTVLSGELMLAFMDKGRRDNIEVGQQYSIYREEKLVLENDTIGTKSLPPVDFGTCLVLHTEATTSTVIITDAADAIAPGEKIRTPIE